MVSMLKAFFSNPIGLSGFVATVISMLVWWVLPLVHINGIYIFSSEWVRSIIIIAIYLFTIAKLIVSFVMEHKKNTFDQCAKIKDNLKQQCQKAYVSCKKKSIEIYADMQEKMQREPGPKLFKKLPLYVLLGTAKSGKNTLINNAGLQLLPASYFGARAEQLCSQHPEYVWMFTDQAIFVICQNDKLKQIKPFIQLLKSLRKRKRHQPLAGVLYSLSMPELMLAKHDDRRNELKLLADQIQLINRYLKIATPLYTLMTKTDLVHGFSEFFNQFSKDELMQLWGITFPLNISQQKAGLESYFDVSFEQLIERLDRQLSLMLDVEKDLEKRKAIYQFPQQVYIFKASISAIINEIFSNLQNANTLQFRGIYFTSAQQTGEPYDFLGHAMHNQFAIRHAKNNHVVENNESYFIFQLLQQVIFKEGNFVGFSLSRKKYKRWVYRSFILGLPLFTLGMAWSFHHAYKKAAFINQQVNEQIDLYQHAKQDLDIHDPSMEQALNILQPLQQAEDYFKNLSTIYWLFLSNDQSYHSVTTAIDRTLTSQFMPRIATNLENVLSRQQLDTNSLYATLKGYLAFSPEDGTDIGSVSAPMTILWQKQYAPDSDKFRQLNYYLQRSTHLDNSSLPIDRKLVDKERLALQQIVPSDRAYALLTVRSMASNLPTIVVSSLAGQAFKQIFDTTQVIPLIPALYTSAGYQEFYSKQLNSIAQQVAEDNRAIGLHAQTEGVESLALIKKEIQIKYNQDYIENWQQLVKHLQFAKPVNLQQAEIMFSILGQSDSPFERLIHIIVNNTQPVSGDYVNVKQEFTAFSQYNGSIISGSLLNETNDDFSKIAKLMDKLADSADPSQAALTYIQQFPQANQDDPLKQLSIIASKSPEPIKQWLNTLAQNTWQVIVQEAYVALNKQWQQQILSNYNQHLAGHYPVDSSSHRSVSVDNFTAFYAPNQIYSQFYQAYFAKYVTFDAQGIIHRKVYNGYQLPLDANTLQFIQQSYNIQQDYFTQQGKLEVKFSLTPASLDKEASAFTLMIGEKAFTYAHGPQEPTYYQWPLDLNESSIDLSVSGFGQSSEHVSSEGPWAIFKIFEKAQIHHTKDGYLMEYQLAGLHFSWICDSDTPLRALTLQDFKNLHIPTQFTVG